MTHEGKVTTNHKMIQKWIESRKGKPATVADTKHKGERAGLLRIDLPGGATNPPLEPISWEDFFQKFDDKKLAFLYQEESADGKTSHFCKLVNRDQ